MKQLSNLIEIFDNFGINIKINYKSKENYKSFLGFLVSLILDFFLLIIGIVILISDFSDSKFFLYFTYLEDSLYQINLNQFPIIFGFEFENGTIINNISSIFSINLSLNTYSKYDILNNKTQIFIEDCDIDKHFYSFSNLFNPLNLTGIKCIIPEQNLNLNYSEHYNMKLIISINKYSYSSYNNYEEIINNGNLIIFFPNHQLNNKNKENPLREKIKKIKLSLYSGLLKSYSYKISNIKYITDKGLIFNSFSKLNFIQISNYEKDIQLSSNNLIGKISFEPSEEDIEYRRHYIKFQEYLSEIVSLTYFLFIIMKYFINIISTKVLSIDIINNLIKRFPNNNSITDVSPINLSKEIGLDNSNINLANLTSKIQGLKKESKNLSVNNSKNILYNNGPQGFSKQLKYIIMKQRPSNSSNINNIIATPSNKRYYNFIKAKEKQMIKNDYCLNTLKGSEFRSVKLSMLKQLFPHFGKTKTKLIEEMIETIDYYSSIENILPIIIKESKNIDDLFSQKENSILYAKKNKSKK